MIPSSLLRQGVSSGYSINYCSVVVGEVEAMTTLDAGGHEQFKEDMRQRWSAAVEEWRKSYAEQVLATAPATEAILEASRVLPGMHVLDIASGLGGPAHALARAVAPAGQVTAIDLVPEMLAVAEDIARSEGLSNITFQQADAESLPFPDEHFDVATCRYGLMFVPNKTRALEEMRRVLKPGGRAAIVAWGPLDENPYFAIVDRVMKKYVPSGQASISVPDLATGLGSPGTLSGLLQEVDFQEVEEETRRIIVPFVSSPSEIVDRVRQGPSRKAFDSLTEEDRRKAFSEIIEAMTEYYNGHRVMFPASIVVASGVR